VKARWWDVDYVAEETRLVAVGPNYKFASLHYDEILIILGVAGLLLGGNLERLY
jgi:hypothetical protein